MSKAKTTHIPLRSCAGCLGKRSKQDMLRIVCREPDLILADPEQCLSGRGAWVCKNNECLEKAVKCKGFDRAFRRPINPLSTRQLLEEYKYE